MALRPSSLVRVSGLLRADRGLAVALPEAERLAALQRRFAGVVPKAVAQACRVAAIQGDVALVFCANGAAASRVRAQAKGVARALDQAADPAEPVTTCSVEASPCPSDSENPARTSSSANPEHRSADIAEPSPTTRYPPS